MARLEHADRLSYSLEGLGRELLGEAWVKRSLKQFMKENKIKSVHELHLNQDPRIRDEWVEYSTFDTVATWKLHECLDGRLQAMPWVEGCGSMLDFYNRYWGPVGEVLVGIEARGIPIDASLLREQERVAKEDVVKLHAAFRAWVQSAYSAKYPGNKQLEGTSERINLGSQAQMRHLLFGQGVKSVSSVAVGGLGLPEHLCKQVGMEPLVN